MHRLFLLVGLCALLGCAAQGANGEQVTRAIQVNYIDVRALAQALGGNFVSLLPTPRGTQNNTGSQPVPLPRTAAAPIAPGVTPAPTPYAGSLDRSAPLGQFVPERITDILGLEL
ncbi:MAG TPA: hypothetical protein VGM23_18400 [Armatimonadota bacterium]|jgi:hypothetical protein